MSRPVQPLLDKLNSLKDHRNELNKELTECIELIVNIQHQYRIESTARVIDFILSEYRHGRLVNLDTLLVHCLNKLHGNIDGVELSLDEQGQPIAVLPMTLSDKPQ